MRTIRVDIAECRLPLPRPIRLGPVTISTRDVVALKVVSDSGLEGHALGYVRGTPLFQIAGHLASHALGISPHERQTMLHGLARALVNSAPSLVRAFSLIDIALADLAARSVALPLSKLLGGFRPSVPVMAVAGYFMAERTNDDIRREVAGLRENGFRRIKVMLLGNDPGRDAELIETLVRDGGDLAADAHWSFQSVAQAVASLRPLDGYNLAFIEDPFDPNQHHQLAKLGAHLNTPIAAGEDVPHLATLLEIGRTAGVLRIDATTCGGVDTAMTAIRAGASEGCDILPHVHLPLHAQIAAACPQIRFVEHIPTHSGADPIHLIVQSEPEIINGEVRVSVEPGAGMTLNWEAVERYAAATVSISKD